MKSVGEVMEAAAARAEAIRTGRRKVSPHFDPPYDSPLESDFAWHAVKYLSEDVTMAKQLGVSTGQKNFRIDFVLWESSNRKVAIECDGKNFHDVNLDEQRDIAILASKAVDVIYRVRGQDAFWHTEDVLFLLCEREPQLFSERGHRNLSIQASESAKNAMRSRGLVLAEYVDEERQLRCDLRLIIRERAP